MKPEPTMEAQVLAAKPNPEPTDKPCTLWELFFVFSKIGLFTFGGGLAMLPLVQKAVVEQKHWMADDDFINMLAITNSLPGAFSINSAVYIGYRERQLPGALAGVLGTVLPSFTVILIIAYLLLWGKDVGWLNKFFLGVRPVVVALILDAGIKLGKKTIKKGFDIVLLVVGTLLVTFTSLNPALLIIAGILIGLIYFRNDTKQQGDSKQEAKQ